MGCFSFVFPKSLSSTSKPDATKPPQGAVSSENVYQYSYGELKTATKGFSIANKIGEGGFGSVYRGTMKDGTFVAVKVLSAESSQGHNEFAAEIASMSFVNHENLVKLHEAWELYKANELVQLVDTMLEADFPKEEAIRFLKVSLLCVQEIPTLRPTMPSAVMMMSNEIDIRHIQISQPGLINDFMKMKIGRRQTSKSIGSIASTSSASVSSMGLKWKRSSSSCN
ncbi:hypothetical protein MRB53_004146 [Persea americana]|uniref:Uncharacterized protein n=1 Tax=Persea americana TaxID=3435 RepID=A0ACC2N009_PERAE|nr:hypothetical protein MRB53_004146 [Persea americana]